MESVRIACFAAIAVAKPTRLCNNPYPVEREDAHNALAGIGDQVASKQKRSRMISRISSVFFAVALVCAVCIEDVQAQTPRDRIHDVSDYVVYYGIGRVDDLKRFSLAIIQPDTLDAPQIASLRTNGTLSVAYLSVGEAEPTRAWFLDGRVDPSWLLGMNGNWGSYFVDASKPGWQQLMYDLAGQFIAKGFDGVFLDTVDTVDVFPQTRDGMLAIIRGLRQRYPDALLVQNRGFSVIQELTNTVDAIMFEDLITSYDFTTGEYLYADNSATAQWLAGLAAGSELEVLSLDYADNPAMAYLAVQAARGYGFIPAVSTILLNDIPDYGLDRGGPADMRVRGIAVEEFKTGPSVISVTFENIGLTASTNALATISIGGELLATTNIVDIGIGKRVVWRVPWLDEPVSVTMQATVSDQTDIHLPNNSLSIDYTAKWKHGSLLLISWLDRVFHGWVTLGIGREYLQPAAHTAVHSCASM